MNRSPSGHRVGQWHQKASHSNAVVAAVRAKYIPYIYGIPKLAKEFSIAESTIRDWVSYSTRFSA